MTNEISTEDWLTEHGEDLAGINSDLVSLLATLKLRLKRSDKTKYNSEVERCFIQLIEAIKNMETK